MADVSSVSSNQRSIEQIIEEQSKKASESTRNTGELGKDDFLKLLITQVQHQDPMNPQSDTDFIAQMAQFSALEQMQNLNNTFSYSMGFSLLGKFISAEITDDKGKVTYVNGRVESVRMSGGNVVAMVDGREVPLDKISQVSDNQIGGSGSVMDYTGIIGLLTKAYLTDVSGKKGTIEGIIASVKEEKDGIYFYLDEVDVKPEDLDLSAYNDDIQTYVNLMTGKEITIKHKDPDTGVEFRVTGTLRNAYLDDNDNVRFVLDRVKTSSDNIYATEKVDLLSTEQMLLNEILKVLRQSAGIGNGSQGENGGAVEDSGDAEDGEADGEGVAEDVQP